MINETDVLYNKGEIEMTESNLIFWGVLIFIGLAFDKYNSKKKRKQISKRLQKGMWAFPACRATGERETYRRGNDDETCRKSCRCNWWWHRYWT
ncbi:hypothetical protein BG07_3825 [Bacillus pseudomycoides]|nr:hypothetical protein DJ92_1111 [Bacillus pseudomycoides]AJI16209.1 hypothetical protein BG07_3825 [Bacillus pseudomycoides]